eukprot:PhM_4_TR7562/c1_g1_i2/m.72164
MSAVWDAAWSCSPRAIAVDSSTTCRTSTAFCSRRCTIVCSTPSDSASRWRSAACWYSSSSPLCSCSRVFAATSAVSSRSRSRRSESNSASSATFCLCRVLARACTSSAAMPPEPLDATICCKRLFSRRSARTSTSEGAVGMACVGAGAAAATSGIGVLAVLVGIAAALVAGCSCWSLGLGGSFVCAFAVVGIADDEGCLASTAAPPSSSESFCCCCCCCCEVEGGDDSVGGVGGGLDCFCCCSYTMGLALSKVCSLACCSTRFDVRGGKLMRGAEEEIGPVASASGDGWNCCCDCCGCPVIRRGIVTLLLLVVVFMTRGLSGGVDVNRTRFAEAVEDVRLKECRPGVERSAWLASCNAFRRVDQSSDMRRR